MSIKQDANNEIRLVIVIYLFRKEGRPSSFNHQKRCKIKIESMELMISVTRTAVPAGAMVFVIIYFFCSIYFVYFDPKYNF